MKKKKENEINKNLHWEEEKRQKMEAIQRDNLRREEENKRRQLEEENSEAANTEESSATDLGGGGSKEMGSTVSDEVKNGLVADDPWLQRKLLEEASASNTSNDAALDNAINQVGGGGCKS